MSENEAKIHLGLFDSFDTEAAIDSYEQKMFDFKDFIVRNAPITALWLARLNKLVLASDALSVLVKDEELTSVSASFEVSLPDEHHPLEWLQKYQFERSKCFLHLQSVTDINDIELVVKYCLALEEQLKKRVLVWFDGWFDCEKQEVSSKEKVDIGILSWNLRQLIDEGAILFTEGKLEKIQETEGVRLFLEKMAKEYCRLKKLNF